MNLESRVANTEKAKDEIVMDVIQDEFGQQKFKTSELTEHFEHTQKTTYNRLIRLEERGLVNRFRRGKATQWQIT